MRPDAGGRGPQGDAGRRSAPRSPASTPTSRTSKPRHRTSQLRPDRR
ncbi:MAG: hypothetical protein M0C28_13295 [Candidatus Moduliflexus flocculans]|nr:hypothetical protein [Candidatus Moduliflexus flocculans]